MNNPPNNLSPTQAASLEALRQCLQNLEEAIASLLQLTLSLLEERLRAQLVDQVSVFDSIADVTRRALDAMEE
jgi:hypothetical protein